MNEKHEETAQRIYKIIMLVLLTTFITFMVTSLTLYTHFTRNPAYTVLTGESKENGTSGLEKYLSKVKKIIDEEYLWKEDINEDLLKDGAVEGYVKALGDEYTEYIPESEMEEFKEDINGSYTGIGIYMVVDKDTNKIIVYYPISDSPAEKAGIKSGDIIVSVDGVEYGYEDFSKIADYIKGKEGTKVKLGIERDGKKLDFEIERAKIEINLVTSKMIEENIGYVKLSSFDENAAKNFKEKVDKLVENGAKSLIIDLRNNGGGIVDSSTDIADFFLEKGKTIITIKDNKQKEEKTVAKQNQTYSMPVVILVNENTASASEILTGALQENNRAKVIGTKTYGKGVIQTVIPLSDGSGLKITTGEYFTPKGTEINKKGITPDIEVKLPETVKSVYAVIEKDDTQLKKAIEELK